MTIDPALLLAYLDDELEEEDRQRVAATLAADPALRAECERQRGLRQTLAAHYAPVLDEPVPARLRAVLQPQVVDLAPARQAARPRRWLAPIALAASLVVGIAIGGQMSDGDDVAIVDGGLVARGALARTLDRQLASDQPAGAPTRVGVSFARADGTLCRTFVTPGAAGLACHEGESWRLLALASAQDGGRGDYRQAASGPPLVLRMAQEMMSGEPFDPAAERQARDRAWRSPSSHLRQ